MLGQLVPCGGGRPLPLLKPQVLVGRLGACDIPLCYPTVSSRHCELEFRDGFWHVHDLGSKNGTRVNGVACTAEQQLLPNDLLGVAGYRFKVAYDLPTEAVPRPKEEPDPGGSAVKTAASAATRPPAAAAAPSYAGRLPFGRLVPTAGGDAIALRRHKLLVGRHESCDVVLRVGTISGQHCQLEWTDEGWLVRDLGSRNGIKVDGVRCEARLLTTGSTLSIAGVRFQVVYSSQDTGYRAFAQSLLEAAGLEKWQPRPEPVGTKAAAQEDAPRARLSLDDPA
jgi:pSer/pThr/pTyr-binding forkhead associated (FHA) protein